MERGNAEALAGTGRDGTLPRSGGHVRVARGQGGELAVKAGVRDGGLVHELKPGTALMLADR
jgi:hypothetical protein